MREKLESVNADGRRDAWDYVRRRLLELRAQEFERARKELRRLDILSFIQATEKLFGTVKTERVECLNAREIFGDTLADWYEATTRAKSKPDAMHLHELRISGKRLRYRLEVLADLGDGTAKSYVNSLKALQDDLGYWHDWHVLLQFVADLNEKPEFVRDHPELQQILARDIGQEKRKNDERVAPILRQTEMLQLTLDSFSSFKAALITLDLPSVST
jgi:CHAD domain-containing protein